MTTHLRTRAIQVGALLAMVGGGLAVAATPALADDPTVQIGNVQSTDLPAGGRTAMSYSVTNNNELPTPIRITVNGNGMSCSGDCSPQAQFQPGETKQFNVQLTAPNVGAGQTRNVTVQINATTAGNDSDSANAQFTVRGADRPQTVTQVEGRVKDQDGKAVGNASVGVRDSAGHSYQTTTGNDGRFVFRSSDANPILAGTLQVGAVKQGFSQVTVSVQGTAGKSLTVPLTLEAAAAPPSASPSATVSVSAPPTEDATDAATGAAALPSAAPTDNAAANQGSSHSLLFIILGALLVAAGVGAIVLVVMRRKSAGDDPDDPVGATAVGGVVPPSRGAFHDATRVAPIGGRNDATMVAGRPSISDAPTMMQQAVPVEDEFPDPYGVPAPQAGYGSYGGAAVPAQPGGYDPGPPTQFEDDRYAAYGAGAGYADTQRRFDEPTGMYRPESTGGYGHDQGYGGYSEPGTSTGSYGAGGGYGQEPEYPAPRRGEQSGDYRGAYGAGRDTGYGAESWDAAAGGIDSGNGYGPAGGGGYGGYDADDYAQRGSYGGRSASPDAGGYGYEGDYRSPSSSDAGYGRSAAPDAGYGRSSDADYGRSSGGGDYRDQGGYNQDGGYGGYYGGAESGGGRHGGQSRAAQPESTRPGQRRSLDWLDD